jgi:hypothetical protein
MLSLPGHFRVSAMHNNTTRRFKMELYCEQERLAAAEAGEGRTELEAEVEGEPVEVSLNV